MNICNDIKKYPNNIDKANKIVKYFNFKKLPIPAVELCRYFGFKIFQCDFLKDEHGFVIISDLLVNNFNTDRIIILNKYDNIDKKRLYCVMALGYYLNNKRCENFKLTNKKADLKEFVKMDKSLEEFASYILLPKENLQQEYDRCLKRNISFIPQIIYEISNIAVLPYMNVSNRFKLIEKENLC